MKAISRPSLEPERNETNDGSTMPKGINSWYRTFNVSFFILNIKFGLFLHTKPFGNIYAKKAKPTIWLYQLVILNKSNICWNIYDSMRLRKKLCFAVKNNDFLI